MIFLLNEENRRVADPHALIDLVFGADEMSGDGHAGDMIGARDGKKSLVDQLDEGRGVVGTGPIVIPKAVDRYIHTLYVYYQYICIHTYIHIYTYTGMNRKKKGQILHGTTMILAALKGKPASVLRKDPQSQLTTA